MKVKLTQLFYGAGEQGKEKRQGIVYVSYPLHGSDVHVLASEHAVLSLM